MQEGDNSLHPLQIVTDELKHKKLKVRLHAIQRLGTIASALGPESTRKELIPLLTSAPLPVRFYPPSLLTRS